MSGSRQNFARTQVRLRPDYQRIARSLRSPGMDTRTWLSVARVDDDDDAITYDPELGWLVDVTFIGGQLDGEGPVVCRVASSGAREGRTESNPLQLGCLVLVAVTAGDPNIEPVIISQLHDVECAAPATVNGTEITEEFAKETHIDAFPGEDLDAEYRAVRVTGESMVLGAAEADQPFARGDDLADALDALAGALDSLATALSGPGSVIGTSMSGGAVTAAVVAAVTTPLSVAVTQFKAARSSYLSSRIRGD